MKLSLSIFLCVIMLHLALAEPPKCYDKNEECHSSNYESYISCVKKRYKRSTDCGTSCESGNCINMCDDCDCNSCNYRNCDNSCNSCCSSCCSNYVPCRTNHCCHKTCQAQCKFFECRSVCRKNCLSTVKESEENQNIPVNEPTSSNNSAVADMRHNITTIIHLNNVINNTNVIDIPIVVNNTNHNNITLYQDKENTDDQNEKCCIVISPRQCVPHNESPYVRCYHYRSRQCGQFCTASIVHKEQQQICQSAYPGAPPNCQQQIMYIPQPQPRCTYQSVWPYVACGIQQQQPSCNGCYNHYVNENSRNHLSCPSGCYDDGFGVGPYYRQGPFYRPTYSHVPCYPCFGYGGYGPYGGGMGYGGYPFGSPGSGFGVPSGGFGPPGFEYAPPGVGYPQPVMPYGSWSPGVADSFGNASFVPKANGSSVSVPFDPLISVGPGLQYPYYDPLRGAREVEIEVNYEPSSSVQAEVKIKQEDKKTETTTEDSSSSKVASTASTKLG